MGVYNIGLGVAIGLWIQPQIFTFISCICVSQEFRYQHGWSRLKTFCGFVASCLFVGGLETGLVFAFKVNHSCPTHIFKLCYQWMTHLYIYIYRKHNKRTIKVEFVSLASCLSFLLLVAFCLNIMRSSVSFIFSKKKKIW